MGRIIVLFALILFISFESFGQFQFCSERLKAIYSSLPDSLKKEVLGGNPDSIYISLSEKKIKLNCLKDMQGRVQHLGLSLFRPEFSYEYPQKIIEFTERLFLEYLFLDYNNDYLKMNKENGIHLLVNDREPVYDAKQKLFLILPLLIDSFDFSYSQTNNKSSVKLNGKKNFVEFLFNSKYNVVSGMDKKEQGEFVFNQLSSFKRSEPIPSFDIEQKNFVAYGDSLWSVPGDDYLNVFNSTVFLEMKDSSTMKYIFDTTHVKESFFNTFLTPNEFNSKITLEVQMNLYGLERKFFKMKLSDFLSYFEKECSFYFGIEKNDKENLTGTLIIQNKELNYINLLHVNALKSDFWSENAIIKSKLFTHIPTDNIKNLFAEN